MPDHQVEEKWTVGVQFISSQLKRKTFWLVVHSLKQITASHFLLLICRQDKIKKKWWRGLAQENGGAN
jgi:hypothetical protein